ncbi:hypothetical protein [Streptomyces katrae]|uniref:hypothetical protein n=1 Tax=Streptomyces katrae TaxID=68223 RepID=UPI0004C1C3DE|nr:hypothetical protein [Streptomyces katrae]
MTNIDAGQNAQSTGGEAQQVSLTFPLDPGPALDARDRLLAAIGQEAQLVAEKYAGQASTALAELARAYALIITALPAPTSHAATRGLTVTDVNSPTVNQQQDIQPGTGFL